MKKLYALLMLTMAIAVVNAQSTRLVLVEEFTGETCPPCAASNPAFNSLLDSYAGQVISLKYQNNIPSAGPNFYAYNIPDVANRTAFYANTYSPHAFLDGNVWNGNAASLTSTLLNNRTPVTSPFEITVEQTFSPAKDIIYVHAVVRATQAVNTANMKLRVAVSEKEVFGYTSPNGEDYYQHVMRKMLPDGNGTALQAVWASGDSLSFDFQWTIAVPTSASIDMPAWARLETIVWVQNDGTKEIIQTGYDVEAQVMIDPSLTGMTGVTPIVCGGSVTPTVTATNYEATTVTSMDIEYYLDSQTPSIYNWTGSLAQGGIINIPLPAINISTSGIHTVNANITNVNGSPDIVTVNNMISKTSGQPLPASTTLTEGFVTPTFPPADWINVNTDNAAGWVYSASGITGNAGSARVDFFDSPQGQIDYMYTIKAADLTSAVSPTLTFSIAHRRYSAAYSDRLDVIVSTNCGQTWTSVWNKSGATLATNATLQTTAYVTPLASHWRLETASLTAYTGMTDVLIAFKATSGFGNNLFLDNINLNTVVGISENKANDLVNIYPVPTADVVTIDLAKIIASDVHVLITDIAGKTVMEQKIVDRSGNLVEINMSELEAGTYFLRLNAGDQTIIKKVILEK